MKKHIITSLIVLIATGCRAEGVNPLRITEIKLIPVNCLTGMPDEATVTITVAGGTPEYEFQVDRKGFKSSNVFPGLDPGTHIFDIRDSNGTSIDAIISVGPSVFSSITIAQAPSCDDRYKQAVITVNSVVVGGTGVIEHDLTFEVEGQSMQQVKAGMNVEFEPIPPSRVSIVSDDESAPPCDPTLFDFELIIPQASGNDIEDFINAKYCIPCIVPS